MDFHELRAMERTHRCSVCKGPLMTVWSPSANKYHLECGHQSHNKNVPPHEGSERRPTMAQECQERERQMRERKPSLSGMTVDDLF